MKLKHFFIATTLCCLMVSAALTTPPSAEAGPNPVVVMETSMGRVMIMLYPGKTPVTVENFLKYVDTGFYDGTLFHRVVRQAVSPTQLKDDTLMNVVQGGGFEYPMKRKRPLAPIINEAASGFQNTRGTIAMARASDPNSATSEFFFNLKNNAHLNYKGGAAWGKKVPDANMGYCAFGRVIRGLEVIDEILKVKTVSMGRMDDVPAKPVYITKAYRAK